jgi:hypothetical protein
VYTISLGLEHTDAHDYACGCLDYSYQKADL